MEPDKELQILGLTSKYGTASDILFGDCTQVIYVCATSLTYGTDTHISSPHNSLCSPKAQLMFSSPIFYCQPGPDAWILPCQHIPEQVIQLCVFVYLPTMPCTDWFDRK